MPEEILSQWRRRRDFRDLKGQRFGRLIVRCQDPNDRNKWLCDCDCGKTTSVNGSALRGGRTVSCRCREAETIAERIRLNTKHGQSATVNGQKGTRTFHIWCHIRARCGNSNSPFYYRYGGRGIKVCERWLESFENFFADMGECPAGLTLDRYPDNDGNYEKSNCRWATPKEQANNRSMRRDARLLTVDGVTMSLSEWARNRNVLLATLQSRVSYGWSAARTVNEPVTRNRWHRPSPIRSSPA